MDNDSEYSDQNETINEYKLSQNEEKNEIQKIA